MVQPQVICVSDRCVRSWAPEFILLGGYDQEPGIMPSSQQDEDLKARLWRASKQFAQNHFYLQERDTVVNEIQLQKNDRLQVLLSRINVQFFINQIWILTIYCFSRLASGQQFPTQRQRAKTGGMRKLPTQTQICWRLFQVGLPWRKSHQNCWETKNTSWFEILQKK